MGARLARIAFDRGGLLGLAVLALYAWVAPDHVVDGDNAEFCTLAAVGGAAHPPGYPLFVLWLRAWRWLPGSPAHAAALATAGLAALSIVVLHAACRAWGARPLAATIACAVFAGAPVVLAMYTEAEVFAANGVIVGLVVWLAAQRGPLRGWQRGAALGLVAGLGLTNQLTCALVAPVGVLGAIRAAREGGALRAVAAALAGLVVGLLPYLYLLIAPVNEASWGDLHGLGDLVHMFLRQDYGGPTVLATDRAPVSLTTSLTALAHTVGRTWWWLLAVGGLGVIVWRSIAAPAPAPAPEPEPEPEPEPDSDSVSASGTATATATASGSATVTAAATGTAAEPRLGWLTLLASLLLSGPVLASRFNIPPEGPGRWVVDRFHLLPSLLLAPAVAFGLDALARRMAARVRLRVPRVLGQIAAVFGFAAIASAALPHLLAVHAPAVERQVVGMLRALPPNAVVIADDDDIGAGMFYAQLALGERPDVDYLHAPLFGLPWYRARVAARGFALDGLIDDAFAHGRPVFVQPTEHDTIAALPHYRFGIFARVLPRGTTLPSLDDIVAQNQAVFASLQLDYPRPGPDDEWPAAVHERYAAAWRQLAEQLAAVGERDAAAQAAEVARELGPRP